MADTAPVLILGHEQLLLVSAVLAPVFLLLPLQLNSENRNLSLIESIKRIAFNFLNHEDLCYVKAENLADLVKKIRMTY